VTTTSNATNTITATPADPSAVMTILVNSYPHTNGTAATWVAGANAIVITVTNGDKIEIYTVEVIAG